MKWFADIRSPEELRQRYKTLLARYHPDNQPSSRDTTAVMQEINSEHDEMIARFSRKKHYARHRTAKSGDGFDAALEREIRCILNALVSLNVGGITIELIGTWIWVYGPGCRASPGLRQALKDLGFRYAPKKKKWHWGRLDRPNRRPVPMDRIREKYGSRVIRQPGSGPDGRLTG